MSKPRLCKILGVEVDQKFTIEGFKDTACEDIYHVDSDGYWVKDDGRDYFDNCDMLCYLIGHPDEIIFKEPRKSVITENDPINHPSHYCSGRYECIDIMLATQGKDDVQGYCVCNAIKYLWRHKGKGGLEDVKKARWYLDEYIKLEEENPEEEGGKKMEIDKDEKIK